MPRLFQQIAILAVVILVLGGAWRMVAADVEAKPAKLRWEFTSSAAMEARGKFDKEKVTEEGWELVAVDQGVLWFKRPKQ